MRLLRQSAFFLMAVFLITMALAVSSFAAQSAPQPKKERPSIQSPTGQAAAIQKQLNLAAHMVQRPNFDQGIYLPTFADGQSTCAAIMSYNFSPGDNPELQSVTTCTPAHPHSVYRTNDERRKRPPAVELQLISVPQRSGSR